jgi:hypothetical protein
MVRFHALVEDQPIDQAVVSRLQQLSDKFRSLNQKAAGAAFGG